MFRLNLVILVIIATVACKSNTSKKEVNETKQSVDIEDLKSEVEEAVSPLPTPFELTEMLNNSGAKYLSDVLNPAENTDKYVTEIKKAVNLGVYGADLSYATTYEVSEDTKQYLKAISTLMSDLGIDVDYAHLIKEEFREKLNNKDSLVAIVSSTIGNTYTYLSEQGKPSMAGVFAAGMWIEGMYIATHISESTFNNSNIVALIYKQSATLKSIIEVLNAHSEDAYVQSILPELNKINEVYDAASESLNEAQFNDIVNTIGSVRAKVVE